MIKRDWSLVLPALSLLGLGLALLARPGAGLLALGGVLIVGAVIAAVHHAETIALKVGEPYGSIILAVAVTVIELSLIVSLILAGGEKTSTLARDTVFSAVMIACSGAVGISLITSSIKHHTARFNPEGTASALATVIILSVLTLVLPNFTDSKPGPEFNTPQLVFASLASLLLYGMFIFMQTVRHRDYFLPPGDKADDPQVHADAQGERGMWISLLALMVSLVAVVGLAKVTAGSLEGLISGIGAPASAIGVIIALIVLLPETIAAVKNAAHGRSQTSFNLAYGSAMASIGLTIPAIALASIWIKAPLVLGLGSTQMVLLFSMAILAGLTVLPGRATLQEGMLHTVLFATFLLLAFIP